MNNDSERNLLYLDHTQTQKLKPSKGLHPKLKVQTEGKLLYKDSSSMKDKSTGKEKHKQTSAKSKINIEFNRPKGSLLSHQVDISQSIAGLPLTAAHAKDKLNFKRKKLSFQNQPTSSRVEKSPMTKKNIFQQICRLGEYSSTPVDYLEENRNSKEVKRKSTEKVQNLLEKYGKGSFSSHVPRHTSDMYQFELLASSLQKEAVSQSKQKPSSRDNNAMQSTKRTRILHQSDQVGSSRIPQTTASQEYTSNTGFPVKRQPSSPQVNVNFFSQGQFPSGNKGFLLVNTQTPTQPKIPKVPNRVEEPITSGEKNRPSSGNKMTTQASAKRKDRIKYTSSYLLATDKKPTPSISMTNLRTPNSKREVKSILAGLQSFREKLQHKTDRPVSVSFVKKLF